MKIRSPLKAIRLKCLDCSADSAKEVQLCPIEDCPLWPYRFGKRPGTAARLGKVTGVKPIPARQSGSATALFSRREADAGSESS